MGPLLLWEARLPEWISVKKEAGYADYTIRHIHYLIARGLVEGRQLGRNWFTFRRASIGAWLPSLGQDPRRHSVGQGQLR